VGIIFAAITAKTASEKKHFPLQVESNALCFRIGGGVDTPFIFKNNDLNAPFSYSTIMYRIDSQKDWPAPSEFSVGLAQLACTVGGAMSDPRRSG
jgi:hypothetical protein